jgi:tetratricopeptide (TPR) repeat protein
VKQGIIVLLLLATAAVGQKPPQTFEELSTMARQAYEANRPEEATQLYTRAVKLQPDWAEGWWALGMIAYENDHYLECRDALTRMVEVDASAAPGWALLGLCEFRTRQYDAAFQHLKKAHMLVSVRQAGGPLLDMADYHLALLLTRQGAFEMAQEILVRVALKVRSNPEMMFAAGLTSLRMPILPSDVAADQRDVVTMAGKTFWDLATQPPAEAEADFSALLTKYPKFPNVHYFYGTYLAARHPEQCVPEFLKELRISPDSVPARVQLTLRFIVEMKLDEALKLAREAVALSPDSVGAQLALADTLRAQGNDEGALAAFMEAKRLDPVSPKIRLYLVNAYRALGRVEDMRREQAEYDHLKADQPNWP